MNRCMWNGSRWETVFCSPHFLLIFLGVFLKIPEYHVDFRLPLHLLDGVQIETETGHMGLISWWNTTTTFDYMFLVFHIEVNRRHWFLENFSTSKIKDLKAEGSHCSPLATLDAPDFFWIRHSRCLLVGPTVAYLVLGFPTERLFSPSEGSATVGKGMGQKHPSQGNPLHSSPDISHSDYRPYSSIPRITPSLRDAFV
jgi:hypothetical protein